MFPPSWQTNVVDWHMNTFHPYTYIHSKSFCVRFNADMQWCLTLLDKCVKKVVQVLVYTSKLSIKTEFQNQISKLEDLCMIQII